MTKIAHIIIALILSSALNAQFTYFNQIAGGVSDTLADAYYNVELIDDTIYHTESSST